jgi:hypothetical protein
MSRFQTLMENYKSNNFVIKFTTKGFGGKYYFERYIFKPKKGRDLGALIEFQTSDKDFNTLERVVLFKNFNEVSKIIVLNDNFLINKENVNKILSTLDSKFSSDTILNIVKDKKALFEKFYNINEENFLNENFQFDFSGINKEKNKPTIGQRIEMFLMKWGQFIPMLVLLTFYVIFLVKKVISEKNEYSASYGSENKLNDFLFKGQTGNEAVFDIYRNVINFLNDTINQKNNGVILYGPPGTSKSYIVRRTLYFAEKRPERDYVILKGSSADAEDNVRIIYYNLYKYNGKIIVFDDFDSALADENVINLLKAALDSYPVRIVSLPGMGVTSSEDQVIPNKFEFTGRIVIITNKPTVDSALASRLRAVKVNFTEKEFIDAIKGMLDFIAPNVELEKKQEVYKYLEFQYNKNPNMNLDFRIFSSLVDIRVAYDENWKERAYDVLYKTTRTSRS